MDSRVTRAIQFMMSKGCVSSNDFIEFLQTMRGDRQSQVTEDKLLEAVGNINSKLRRYNMEIRYSLDDKTHERFYTLISKVDNLVTRLATHHTDKEFDYFKLIFQHLQDGAKPLEDMFSLTPLLQAKQQKELVDEWVRKHWLVIDDDHIRLGPRSMAELDVIIDVNRNEPQPGTSAASA